MIGKNLLRPTQIVRNSVRNLNLTVVGSANELGRTACLLLRSEPRVTQLRVCDNAPHVSAIATDLTHVPAPSTVHAYCGNLPTALRAAHVVLLMGDALPHPTLNHRALVSANAAHVRAVAAEIANHDPLPYVAVAAEPVTTLVPLFAEVLKAAGNYDPRKLFGVTNVDAMRAKAMYAAMHGLKPQACVVPVIGGHTRNTLVPLLSQATPQRPMSDEMIALFTEEFQGVHDSILNARDGFYPIQSTAYSILIFIKELVSALSCTTTPLIHTFIDNNDFGTGFFAGNVKMTADGVGEMERYPKLTPYECDLLERSCNQLRLEVESGNKLGETLAS